LIRSKSIHAISGQVGQPVPKLRKGLCVGWSAEDFCCNFRGKS
jgi:hypothetical protein